MLNRNTATASLMAALGVLPEGAATAQKGRRSPEALSCGAGFIRATAAVESATR